MSVNPTDAPALPSWADVLALVARLDESGLEDAEIVMDGLSVRVSRSALPDGRTTASQEPAVTTSEHDETPSPDAVQAAPAPAAVADGPVVTAPMLGVLYLRPSPDADPFVKVGDTVSPDTTVAIIEVMKLMNNVSAGAQGTVAEICGHEGQMVEHGDVLIRLEAG